MKTVTTYEAKTHLAQLLAEAEAGDEIIISQNRHAEVRLVPVREVEPKRVFGALAGQVVGGSEFFEPMPTSDIALWER